MEVKENELNSTAIAEKWIKEKIINLDENGLEVDNSHDLGDVFFKLFRKKVKRLPIIGTKEGTYMLAVTEEERPEHWTLYQKLGAPQDVIFTTSIELQGIPSDLIPSKQWMHLKDNGGRYEGYVTMGNGSDKLTEQFNIQGREVMKNVLAPIEGVELSWK